LDKIVIALVLACSPGAAQEVSAGFQHFYNLEYPEALRWFEGEAAAAPSDPEPYNHIAQTILYAELYRNGSLESELVSGANPFLRRPGLNPSPGDQRKFFQAVGQATALCEPRLKTDPKDKLALYALGVAYSLKGSYEFLVRKAYADALKDAGKARKYHQRITDMDPDFTDALLVQGLHEYIVGSLPRGIRWLGFLAGVHGDKARGIEMMRQVEVFGKRTRLDAEILLAAAYRRDKRFAEAVPLLSVLSERFPRNYILKFELVQIYSDLGDRRRALETLDEIERLRASKAPGYARLSPERVEFARGNFLFWYDGWDEAIELLKSATSNLQALDLNSGVLAWMRLGQLYDLKRNHELAVPAYKHAIDFAPGSDAAKESKRYLSAPYLRRAARP
jgi:tetratricopeptide (TPR) repeat protein